MQTLPEHETGRRTGSSRKNGDATGKFGRKTCFACLWPELRLCINNSRKAIRAYREALQVLKVCETECEMACTALRRQYENNYLDARKQLGKVLAERMFPKLTVGSKSDKAPVKEA